VCIAPVTAQVMMTLFAMAVSFVEIKRFHRRDAKAQRRREEGRSVFSGFVNAAG
jgi:hypothetical protein